MPITKLPKAYSQYGASMGRRGEIVDPDFDGEITVEELFLDSGGYDTGGAYWGSGGALWRATGEEVEQYFRARDIEAALAHVRGLYPLASVSGRPMSDDELREYEQEAADETWRNCYSPSERVAYIREHRSQFEFHTLADMLGCVRGHYFAGYASELA